MKRAILGAVLSFSAGAVAAPITPGNLVIYRVGDGAATLLNTGAAVFVDEYNTAGGLVQSLAMPTTASGSQKQLIASGTATSEGMLTVSPNGQYVALTGYGTNIPTAGLAGSSAATVNRVVGILPVGTGLVDTSTGLTDFSDANNPRSAVTTNGTDIWVAGGAGGVRYTTFGATTSTQLQTLANNRQVNVFDGQLYASNDSTAGGNTVIIGAIGTGLPTTSGQPYTSLPGFITHPTTASASTYSYFLADLDAGVAGPDTMYVADDAALALTKYSLVGGNWTANGTIGVDTDDYRGVTGAVNGSSVTLFATRKGGSGAAGGGELVSLLDASGYNGAFAGAPTLLATAATNTAFRGVAIVVPEPATIGLLGMTALLAIRRRK